MLDHRSLDLPRSWTSAPPTDAAPTSLPQPRDQPSARAPCLWSSTPLDATREVTQDLYLAYFLVSLLQVHPRCHQHHGFLPSKGQLVFGSPGSCGYVRGAQSRELSRGHRGDADRPPAGVWKAHREGHTPEKVGRTCNIKTRAHSHGTRSRENWGCAAQRHSRAVTLLFWRVVQSAGWLRLQPLEKPTYSMFSPQERQCGQGTAEASGEDSAIQKRLQSTPSQHK